MNQTIGMLFRTDGESVYLLDLYREGAAFLVAGGHSFQSVDCRILDGLWVMTLNNAVRSFRGNASCIVDEPARFSLSMWLDPTVQKFVPTEILGAGLWDNRLLKKERGWEQQWRASDLKVRDCPNVVGYRRNELFRPEKFLQEPTINWGCSPRLGGGKSVMLPALRILFLLGFRKIFLLGVDFEMTKEKKYHFPEERSRAEIAGNMRTYAKLERWLAQLQPFFLREGFVVKNCNLESKLRAFPFIPFQDAIEEATRHLGDYTRERTTGMYTRLADRIQETQEDTPVT